jgi:hypothetical protein
LPKKLDFHNPRFSATKTDPVVWWNFFSVIVRSVRLSPDVIVGVRTSGVIHTVLKPVGLVASVVWDKVKDHVHSCSNKSYNRGIQINEKYLEHSKKKNNNNNNNTEKSVRYLHLVYLVTLTQINQIATILCKEQKGNISTLEKVASQLPFD